MFKKNTCKLSRLMEGYLPFILESEIAWPVLNKWSLNTSDLTSYP